MLWYSPVWQIEDARNRGSEASTKLHNSLSDAQEKAEELDRLYKDLTKEVQILSKEKEAMDKQRTEAIQKRAKLELDDNDLQERISTNIKAKVRKLDNVLCYNCLEFSLFIHLFQLLGVQEDAAKQLEILEKEIQESTNELNKMKPLYEGQVKEEEEITRGYDHGSFQKTLWSIRCWSWHAIFVQLTRSYLNLFSVPN